jgi:hypothetical protein
MSNPQEKAKELIQKMIDTYYDTSDFVYNSSAKKCALIAQENLLDKLASLNIKDEFEEAVLFEINVL